MNFEKLFPNEASCLAYTLAKTAKYRHCSRCGADVWGSKTRVRKICSECGYQMLEREQTLFKFSRLPLRTWFKAIYLFCRLNEKTSVSRSISALRLKEELGLGSYRTAFHLLQDIRSIVPLQSEVKLGGEIHLSPTKIESGKKPVSLVVAANQLNEIRVFLMSETNSPEFYDLYFSSQYRPWNFSDRLMRNSYPKKSTLVYPSDLTLKIPSNFISMKYTSLNPDKGMLEARELVQRFFSAHRGLKDERHIHGYLNEFSFMHNFRMSDEKSRFLTSTQKFKFLLDRAILHGRSLK